MRRSMVVLLFALMAGGFLCRGEASGRLAARPAYTVMQGAAFAVRSRPPEMCFTGQLPERAQLENLMQCCPGIRICWKPDRGISPEQLAAGLENGDLLTRLDLRQSGLPVDSLRSLAGEYPDIACVYEETVLGRSFPVDAVQIDLSDIPLTDTAEVEESLQYFPMLKKVLLCRCGLSNETLDALDRKYENIRFVWELTFGVYKVRTDTTFFAPVTMGEVILWGEAMEHISDIRYCRDIICVDLGHHISLTDVSWAAELPRLKYLIIADTGVSDISPLAACKNLVYLEIFLTRITDLSPLVSCTSLVDLNASYLDQADPAPLLQMPWLQHLWMNYCFRAGELLEGKLPNTVCCIRAYGSTDGGWRRIPNYYAMRDVLGMYYADG